jgi:hypothetical protein
MRYVIYIQTNPLKIGTEDLNALLNWLELLLAGRGLDGTKDQLSLELPVAGDIKSFGDTRVDEGVVVLEVGAEAEGLETGPDCALLVPGSEGERERDELTEPLVHGVAVLGPLGEFVGKGREFLAIGLYVGGVLVEEDLQKVNQ